ncbi:hypothetical protein ACJO5Y_18220, partial [Marinobacter sp. GN3S48]|uniref:hypothetical protein n=1 Tax=Marinobacter sp. GN3S48 TaxID=3382302 RepID=UPI00387B7D7B
ALGEKLGLLEFKQAVLGLPVNHVWLGHGSAIFVELGELSPTYLRDGSTGNPSGNFTLMVEWSWRIEKPRSILGGSYSSARRWPSMLKKLLGSTVTGLETIGAIPEIQLSLSNGTRVVSFMTESGQPQWALISRQPGFGTLCVKNGRVCVDSGNS